MVGLLKTAGKMVMFFLFIRLVYDYLDICALTHCIVMRSDALHFMRSDALHFMRSDALDSTFLVNQCLGFIFMSTFSCSIRPSDALAAKTAGKMVMFFLFIRLVYLDICALTHCIVMRFDGLYFTRSDALACTFLVQTWWYLQKFIN